MKKQVLSFVAVLALFSVGYAQTTTYLDFEGATPSNSTFGGSSFSIVDNPSMTGVNTSAKVAMTQKAETGAEWWGGAAFPCGGTIDFASGDQSFSIDVYSSIAGEVMFKVEQGAQGAVEIRGNYTTPNEWQTITIDMSTGTPGQLDPDYKQIVIFMGVTDNLVTTDEWYYDNVKGPGFTAGDVVDVTFMITDQGGTATSMEVELSNNLGTKVALDGTAGVGATWTTDMIGVTGSTIVAPITFTLFVNGAAVPEITNQAFAMAGSIDPIISKSFGTAPEGAELLTNGGFDDIEGMLVGRTANEWGMWTQNGGTAEVIDGVVNVTPVEGTENWHMQVEQWNFAVENDVTYVVHFDAWADTDRIICLTIEDPANGYATLGTSDDEGAYDIDDVTRSKWDINITTDQTTYELTLTVDAMLENSTPKFAFLLAQTSDMVYLDNVSLMQEGSSVPSTPASSLTVYPNPTHGEVYVNASAGTVVAIYSITGKLVLSNVAASEINKIDVSSLAAGVYMLKVGNNTEKLVIK